MTGSRPTCLLFLRALSFDGTTKRAKYYLNQILKVLFLNSLVMCSSKKCDNLLVEVDIFTILGDSFCVTQNALNLIDKKGRRQLHSSVSLILKYVILF